MKQQVNWRVGFLLSLITVFFWSTLPIALKISLDVLDAWTVTWIRFVFAAGFTCLLLLAKKQLHQFGSLKPKDWLWLLLAAAMLLGNFLFFLYGLEMTSPGNAQVFIQLAPLLMTLGGVLIFKEPFSKTQMLGAMLVVGGLTAFFFDQIVQIISSEYTLGLWVMVAAAVTWAIYSLIQKKLAKQLSSQNILLFIYCFCSIALIFGIQFEPRQALNTTAIIAILYAAINTVGAYGAFAEALNHWHASRVGMVLALTPVFTLFFINLFAGLFPHLLGKELIQTWGYLGVLMIVSGSMMASLKKT